MPLLKLKRKNMPSPPWFLVPLKVQSGAVSSLGVSSTKTGLPPKDPLQHHSVPRLRESGNMLQQVGGRGRERLPLRLRP